MSNSRHNPANRQRPVGRPDKSVYRKRRIIALVVLAVAVALVWSLVAALVSFVQGVVNGNPAASGTGVIAEGACDVSKISLVPVVADASGAASASFDTGINPFFGYTITNTGDKDCNFDLGQKETYFKVTSGSETIWNSVDCDRTGLTTMPITLKAGETKKSDLSVSDWYRVKSSSTGCGADQEPVTAGGASYHLSVEVGGALSKDTAQFILN
jgi:hypothetical protein